MKTARYIIKSLHEVSSYICFCGGIAVGVYAAITLGVWDVILLNFCAVIINIGCAISLRLIKEEQQ